MIAVRDNSRNGIDAIFQRKQALASGAKETPICVVTRWALRYSRQLMSAINHLLGIVMVVTFMSVGIFAAEHWKPANGPLVTRWAKDVSPERALPEYPRPQMVRDNWVNLNGLWDYAIAPKADAAPKEYQGKILVPFPVESALSGVKKMVGADNKLWYRRNFETPKDAAGKRLLIHFGAVD